MARGENHDNDSHDADVNDCHDDDGVENLDCLQVGGKPSRWPQVLVTLAYAEKVPRLAFLP